jgi:enoyl-CoA hydratase/carnithine racemase
MNFEHIEVSKDGYVATLRLNRPDALNAMTLDMGREIESAVDRLNSDDDIRVVVVTGAGKAFSSGGDLKTLAKEAGLSDEGSDLGGGRVFYGSFLSVRNLRMPSIAAINGHAIGAGLCFSLGCDLRVMHSRAKVGMTFVKIGIHPGMAATWNLPRIIGPTRAADLLYTGRLLGADEALELGLVNRTGGDDFAEQVSELAGQIAGNGPVAVRALKDTLRGTTDRTIEEALGAEADAQAMTFETDDSKEGIRAVMEKRIPKFSGK